MRKEPVTIWVTLAAVISAQLKVQSCGGALGSTWLQMSCAPPCIAAPPQDTAEAATAGDHGSSARPNSITLKLDRQDTVYLVENPLSMRLPSDPDSAAPC